MDGRHVRRTTFSGRACTAHGDRRATFYGRPGRDISPVEQRRYAGLFAANAYYGGIARYPLSALLFFAGVNGACPAAAAGCNRRGAQGGNSDRVHGAACVCEQTVSYGGQSSLCGGGMALRNIWVINAHLERT